MLTPKREEYQLRGRELVHLPTGLPITLPYSNEGLPRTVRYRKREMDQLREVLDFGVQILIERVARCDPNQ